VTALKSKVSIKGVYEAIEWTVQNRARIETIGSSLSTLVLTKLLLNVKSNMILHMMPMFNVI
jgi:hypothetical protein